MSGDGGAGGFSVGIMVCLRPNQWCYHSALFLVALYFLHPFWSNIYQLHDASPSFPSYTENPHSPPARCIYFGVVDKAKLPKSSHPALNHHLLLQHNLAGASLGENPRKTAKLKHRLLGCSWAWQSMWSLLFSQLVQKLNLQGTGLFWA